NPWLDPYEAFLKFKRHPFVAAMIAGGKVLEQGARTVCSGGLYTIPRLALDGALVVGGAAAMQNMQALKGIHLSMKSGMLAAEAIDQAFGAGRFDRASLSHYGQLFRQSWAYGEMHDSRNFAQALAKKGAAKFIHLGAQYVTQGRGISDPMELADDSTTLKPAGAAARGVFSGIAPENIDGKLYVDKLTGVYLSKTQHREDQPCHLIVHDTQRCITDCYHTYRNPCTRFCPGNVYEIEADEATGQRSLKLNPANCFHCKTCDIKDPYGNITWTCPEGGDGPGYLMV
ncbi:MAG: 4Fe-4S dicluster domain-containing protein, partial [Desulfobacterales bacterium]